ncbi:MAG: trypsin-like peptidase domain-containing protein [Acidobacteria bacterium]|nr:trypsin-like peptidase domain-containing protein [Acidobacteriota bacterium]
MLRGRTYEWRETVDLTAGATATIALTADNAETRTAAPSVGTPGAPPTMDHWDILVEWQDSVVEVWTPLMHATGLVIDTTGFIATSQRVLKGATQVEVQVTPLTKVAATVVASNEERDVAILRVDPELLLSRRQVPLDCASPARDVSRGQVLGAIGMPMRRQPTAARGVVFRLEPGAVTADFDVPLDSPGGPAFATDGTLVGLTSPVETVRESDPPIRVVRIGALCEVLTAARAAMPTPPPSRIALPVEPVQVVTDDVVREGVKQRTGSLTSPRVSSSGFDVDLITPVTAYASEYAMDFGQWSRYVADKPAVLLVRAAPRQVESLWMKVARGAALTQGIALPPIKRYEPGFANLRARCGTGDIIPIHPFIVERRISETAAIREGLYVFAPDAFGPHCGTITLEIASEKTPDKTESVRLTGPMLERIWQDMAPFREPPPAR